MREARYPSFVRFTLIKKMHIERIVRDIYEVNGKK